MRKGRMIDGHGVCQLVAVQPALSATHVRMTSATTTIIKMDKPAKQTASYHHHHILKDISAGGGVVFGCS
jgi:hypothetical protein